jgi:hypothetical protein
MFLTKKRDLADINKSGRISREEFILAMYLIHQKLSGHELPSSLPANLIPLTMRKVAGKLVFNNLCS